MMIRSSHVVAALAVCSALTASAPATAGPGQEPLRTRYELMIGVPPEAPEAAGARPLATGEVLFAEDGVTSHDLSPLKEKLRFTYRLKAVYTTAVATKDIAVGETVAMPAEPSELAVEVKLQGYDDEVATYVVHLSAGKEVLADAKIVVRSGGRAIVAARDGERAPYAFIVIEARPDLPMPRKSDGATAPRVVEKVNPVYPEEARKARVQGTVVLSLTLAPDGRVMDVMVLEAAGSGLTEAAADAVKRWRYEPAGGTQTRVITATVTFRLQ